MAFLRTAVVGAGKMGSLHARVYSGLPESRLTAVVDSDEARAKALAEQYGCEALTDPKDLIGRVDAVTIAAPTAVHFSLAEVFLHHRIPVLIEKPLASNVEEGRQLVRLARQTGTLVAVGHSERCNPVVQAMKRLEIEPRFIESNRVSPYPFRSSDVGVVLDVMIHDIDIILSLARSPVCQVEAVGVNVIGEHEDICNARLVFENGCIANITASRLALKTERKVRVFSRQAYLSVDYFRKEGIVIKTDPNVDVIRWIREHQQAGDFDFSQVKWTELLHIEHLDITESEPLRVEQEAFLRSVLHPGERPEVTAEEGLAALECADLILQKVRRHRWNA